ncbi:MAG: PTS fructose transporter subunit IIC [Propioniciclava sp.]
MPLPRIIAATGCPTGIAHTFMAEEALKNAAEERGVSIKVETHGQVGIENALTAEEIAGAEAVIIAADKDVQASRFAGKPLVDVSVKEAIHNAGALVDQVLAQAAVATRVAAVATAAPGHEDSEDLLNVAAIDTASAPPGWRRGLRAVYKHLMNGVSHMLPFVVGGGVLIAISFLWGIYSADPENEQYNAIAAMLMSVGGVALGLMVPILSAFIASSIAQRPGLTVGLVTGMIVSTGGAGFLGGIVSGFLSGYGMLLIQKLLAFMPQSMNGLKAIFLYPLLGVFAWGGITYLLVEPLAGVSVSLQNVLSGFQNSNPILLGVIVGVMCAFDMGGPVNKAAYVTGVALLGDGNFFFMAGVSAACIAPPLVTAFATVLFPKGFEPAERRAGAVNFVLGSTHITEGAIPFAARNPIVVLPILMVSSSIAAVLTYLWQVQDPAPHGGFLVLPVVTNPVAWVAAILIGSLVGAVMFGFYRLRRAQRMAPVTATEPVPVGVPA